MDSKSLTLRLPVDLYSQIAVHEPKSINSYVVEAVKEKLAREKEEELRIGFASLGGDNDEEHAFWMQAQREAMKHIDD